jgi:hypothetical protein
MSIVVWSYMQCVCVCVCIYIYIYIYIHIHQGSVVIVFMCMIVCVRMMAQVHCFVKVIYDVHARDMSMCINTCRSRIHEYIVKHSHLLITTLSHHRSCNPSTVHVCVKYTHMQDAHVHHRATACGTRSGGSPRCRDAREDSKTPGVPSSA